MRGALGRALGLSVQDHSQVRAVDTSIILSPSSPLVAFHS